LIGEATAKRIAFYARDARVLEIGPGLGSLTLPMSEIAREVIGVEKDAKLFDILEDTFRLVPNVRFIKANVLTIDLTEVLGRGPEPWIAVGNLPYRVASQILMFLLERPTSAIPSPRPQTPDPQPPTPDPRPLFKDIYITVQKEFADRILAEPGNRTYGRLTVMIRYHADVKRLFDLDPELFYPRPKVHSTFLHLAPHGKYRLSPDEYRFFAELVKAAFSTRRKTILNALAGVSIDLGTKQQIRAALERNGIDAGARAETIQVAGFTRLSDSLYT
jgi:16S rRNA (adenine1518-N6/adenine1519-N6)-dimethyltransferase